MVTQSSASLTSAEITEDYLVVLKNKLGVASRCIRSLDGEFGVNGRKIGDTINVRVPIRTQSVVGPALVVQPANETQVPIQANTQRQISYAFSTKDVALSIDEYSDRYNKPSAAQLASDIDSDGLSAAAVGVTVNNTPGYYSSANSAGQYVGFQSLVTTGLNTGGNTPLAWTGNVLGSGATANAYLAQAPFWNARTALESQACPVGERYFVISPQAMGAIAPNLTSLFNPSKQISEVFEDSLMGPIAGFMVFESQNIPTFTSGTWSNAGAGANVAAFANNTNSLTLANCATGQTIVIGDQLVIAGVFSVNPLNRQSTGQLQVFTAISACTAAANAATFTVYPTLYAGSQQYQTVTAVPGANAAVTFMGTPNTSTQVNIAYHKEALAMAVAALADVSGQGAECYVATDEEDGFSVRYIKQYQSSTDLLNERMELLYGFQVVRPSLGVRIQA